LSEADIPEFLKPGVCGATGTAATMVFQKQLTHSLDAVPVTRDYMVDVERRAEADALSARASSLTIRSVS
jgi:hypothetical protein